ncbi:MAG: hypothetical protein IIA45_13090, partial [Bacteroidetes bacterium]|nr:hypothetical protein [Bacteroidota bacterium]
DQYYVKGEKQPLNGRYSDRYPGGQIKHKCTFKDGLFHKKYKSWYSNGWAAKRKRYKNGQLHGKWVNWYPKVLQQEKFLEGSCETGSYSYYTLETDKPVAAFVKNFKNDTLNGKYTDWHFTGKIRTIGNYVNGHKMGEWVFWNNNEELVGRCTYYKDTLQNGVFLNWHENGLIALEGQAYESKRIGTWYGYSEDGYKSLEMSYLNGKLEDRYYYMVRCEYTLRGNYSNGLRHGEWSYEYQDGKTKIETWDRGELIKTQWRP